MVILFSWTLFIRLHIFQMHLDALKPAWEALELLQEQELIMSLGISDLNAEQLLELYNWAKVDCELNIE